MRRQTFSALELALATAFAAIIVVSVILVVDPLERARQQRDARVKQDAGMLLSAINQYFLSHGRLPWGSIDAPSPPLPWTSVDKPEVGIEKLVNAGVLPQDFPYRKTILDPKDRFFLAKGASSTSPIFACFVPESEKQRLRTGELYNPDIKSTFPQTGVLPSCPSSVTWDDEDVCYICLKR